LDPSIGKNKRLDGKNWKSVGANIRAKKQKKYLGIVAKLFFFLVFWDSILTIFFLLKITIKDVLYISIVSLNHLNNGFDI
jgi:hypothetical protein